MELSRPKDSGFVTTFYSNFRLTMRQAQHIVVYVLPAGLQPHHSDEMLRVMLVDGDPDSRTVYRTILRHHGIEVVEAPDAETASRLLESRELDVVVTELTVPGKSGIDLIQEIRRSPKAAGVCIIVLTAIGFEREKQKALDAGCQKVLVKPIEPLVLLNEIRQLNPG